MTDHERLCELLERIGSCVRLFGFPEEFTQLQDMVARLHSNGPDGLRVVPRNLPDNVAIEISGFSHPDGYGLYQQDWATTLALLCAAGGERAD